MVGNIGGPLVETDHVVGFDFVLRDVGEIGIGVVSLGVRIGAIAVISNARNAFEIRLPTHGGLTHFAGEIVVVHFLGEVEIVGDAGADREHEVVADGGVDVGIEILRDGVFTGEAIDVRGVRVADDRLVALVFEDDEDDFAGCGVYGFQRRWSLVGEVYAPTTHQREETKSGTAQTK